MYISVYCWRRIYLPSEGFSAFNSSSEQMFKIPRPTPVTKSNHKNLVFSTEWLQEVNKIYLSQQGTARTKKKHSQSLVTSRDVARYWTAWCWLIYCRKQSRMPVKKKTSKRKFQSFHKFTQSTLYLIIVNVKIVRSTENSDQGRKAFFCRAIHFISGVLRLVSSYHTQ